jgi:hypothetical protein
MLGLGWLALRQAQEALKNGRLEEAHRLLGQVTVQGHKRSYDLLQQLARAFAERGERHLREDDPVAAWNDLLLAEQAAESEHAAARLRHALTRLGMAEVRSLLEAGDPGRAVEAIAHLRERVVRSPELDRLEEVARDWERVREQAARGEFPQARQALDRARRLPASRLAALDRFHDELEQQAAQFSVLLVKLHDAAQRKAWHEVMQLAEQTLAIAPNHAEARKARAQAWKAIEPTTVVVARPNVQAEHQPPAPDPSKRFLLWIDGIGGYLVCLANRVTLGQALPDALVDVPVFADVSRVHATLTRDTEGYLLEAGRPVRVNGQAVERALLRTGDRVTLGNSCQFQFHQPVPISTSARLDLVSGHRLRLAVEAVLLMADTLVLGPGPQAHVIVPDLAEPVVLFRTKDGLGIRSPGKLMIDGHSHHQRGSLGATASVSGEDFTLAIEPVGLRLGR